MEVELRSEAFIGFPNQIEVFSDQKRFKQLMQNLVGNSLTFTRQGHIIIRMDFIGQLPIGVAGREESKEVVEDPQIKFL